MTNVTNFPKPHGNNNPFKLKREFCREVWILSLADSLFLEDFRFVRIYFLCCPCDLIKSDMACWRGERGV